MVNLHLSFLRKTMIFVTFEPKMKIHESCDGFRLYKSGINIYLWMLKLSPKNKKFWFLSNSGQFCCFWPKIWLKSRLKLGQIWWNYVHNSYYLGSTIGKCFRGIRVILCISESFLARTSFSAIFGPKTWLKFWLTLRQSWWNYFNTSFYPTGTVETILGEIRVILWIS